MKKILSAVILCFFMYSSIAQTNYYRGEWTVKDKTTLFTCLCKIEIQKDGIVRTEFIWKYISIDSNNTELVQAYKDKKGKTGIEYSEGRYEAGTGDIYLQTESMTDPHHILGPSKYYIRLSADKQALYGTTTNPNGEEPGLIYAIKLSSPAAKEFNVLKSKVKE